MSGNGEEEGGERRIQRGSGARSLKTFQTSVRTLAFIPYTQLESSLFSFLHTCARNSVDAVSITEPKYNHFSDSKHHELSPESLQ